MIDPTKFLAVITGVVLLVIVVLLLQVKKDEGGHHELLLLGSLPLAWLAYIWRRARNKKRKEQI